MLFVRQRYETLLVGLATAASFMFAVSVMAEDVTTELKPVPETEAVDSQCPHCQHGLTQDPNLVNGEGYYGQCPNCRGGLFCRGGRIFNRNGNGIFGGGNRPQRVAPGTGWCPPTKVTIQRERVQYQKYYPNYWSGYGPGPAMPYHPMVYTPTDTTQLGYTYQHVPTWTAQPWRTPGPAHPAYWHNRYCGRFGDGQFGRNGRNGNCPTCQRNGMVSYGMEVPAEQGEQSTPTPATPNEPIEAIIEGDAPQTFDVPAPAFPFNPPRLSVLPEAPPEV